jgi:uncharacterized membrane protein
MLAPIGSSNAEAPTMTRSLRHPVNRQLVDAASRGEQLAIAVTGFIGSWRFIAIQTVIVGVWVAGNIYLLFAFDPYPFILLNLAFSTQAAYAAPLILLAGNRAALRDRMTLEHAAAEADLEARQNEELLRGTAELLARLERLERRLADSEGRILTAVETRGRRT